MFRGILTFGVFTLLSRIAGLYGAIGRWAGAPTKDQMSRLAYYQSMAKQLAAKAP